MNPTGLVAGAIESLVAEREQLASRLQKVDAAISAVREAFHLPQPAPARPERTPSPTKKNGNGRSSELTVDAITKALKAGPMKPGDLSSALGVERARLRSRLAEMETRGVVVSTGVTMSRRVALAGSRPKEAP